MPVSASIDFKNITAMKLKFITKALLCLGFSLAMSSCDIGDDDNYYYPPQNQNVAYGIIANASPSSGDLYFFADENSVNNNPLNYGAAAGYYNFYLGERVLSIQNNAGDTLATTEITLEQGDYFSAFAVNTFDSIELVTYRDSLEYPASGTALVRFINLSPDADSIDITGISQSFATGLEFKAATEFISVQSGTYDFTFTASETDEELFDDTLQFYAGRIYTVYTKGFVTPPTGSNETFSTEVMLNY